MSENTQNLPENQAPNTDTQADDPANQSRRRLTGAGLGVSAIFTLASRPVLAGQCTSPSSAASGNLSTHGTPPQCTGHSPPVWVQLNAGKDVTFHVKNLTNNKDGNGVFVSGDRADWGGKTLHQVMSDSGSGNSGKTPNPISKEFAAALLNIRGGLIPAGVLTEMNLIGMWSEWMVDGSFSPQAGVDWDATTIVNYLKTLQS